MKIRVTVAPKRMLLVEVPEPSRKKLAEAEEGDIVFLAVRVVKVHQR